MCEILRRLKIVVEEVKTPNGCNECSFGTDGCGLESIMHNLRCCGVDCGGNSALRFVGVEGVPIETDSALTVELGENGRCTPKGAANIRKYLDQHLLQDQEKSNHDQEKSNHVMLSTNGKPFRCECGCNVFVLRDDGMYQCNACPAMYQGSVEG